MNNPEKDSTNQNQNKQAFQKADPAQLKGKLTDLQYKVTMEAATEAPFANEYNDTEEPGLYVDITTGEPLFSSDKKFDSGCGWPSFTAALSEELIEEKVDLSHGRRRTEVRSKLGDAHLGHVFADGPEEDGGLRYCINSAALRFIPYTKLVEEGYGEWQDQVDPKKRYKRYSH